MAPVLLALSSAVMFGALAVTLRIAFQNGATADEGALVTVAVAFVVALAWSLVRSPHGFTDAMPYLAAGALAPGLSQLLFTVAIVLAGASRTSLVTGTAPLFAVALSLAWLGEPAQPVVLAGGALIIVGASVLAFERERPPGFRAVGVGVALIGAVTIGTRDAVVRKLALDGTAPPGVGATAATLAGLVVIAAVISVRRTPLDRRHLAACLPSGVLFGVSYLCLFEAYARGVVAVVSPLIATECLWAVGLSALVLQRSEVVGRRLATGACLVVAGGVLIGAFH